MKVLYKGSHFISNCAFHHFGMITVYLCDFDDSNILAYIWFTPELFIVVLFVYPDLLLSVFVSLFPLIGSVCDIRTNMISCTVPYSKEIFEENQ